MAAMTTQGPRDRRSARLALEDGSVFCGSGFGSAATTEAGGEVVFCTAMSGYQEAISDPSYTGQILVLTAPMIGNYGIADDDSESGGPKIAGLVVRECSRMHSNHRAVRSLPEWLSSAGVPAIEGLDTRALVRRLRAGGAMRGVISMDPAVSDDALVERARAVPPMAGSNLVTAAGPAHTEPWGSTEGGDGPLVAAIDCGGKASIYRALAARGCRILRLSPEATAEEIRAVGPDGLFISNGPGDPAAVETTISTLRDVAGEIPTFGICLGHQLLCLAMGAETFKLRFGHHGSNQPVRNLLTGHVEITSQNHGFCVDPDSLRAAGGDPTHVHLNDGTIAGMRDPRRPIFSVQYHPEAGPGPHDSGYLFDWFVGLMGDGGPLSDELVCRLPVDRRSRPDRPPTTLTPAAG